ncbi:MAG: glycosyltransferase [Clostridiales bacterium]|jgi:glycosyltransferase involved in cell wall biosynthesis|nr:glycosyltransferase [Clostridiales bacterium]
MSKETVSVVVPVYNAEKFLEKCVDSILAQTYTDLRVILVDDGSPDASPAICDSYKEKDSRVVVIHKKNAGVSAARNDGIELAEGGYITFVDSDDYISETMVEDLYNALGASDISAIKKAEIVGKPNQMLDGSPIELSGTQPALELCRQFVEREPLITAVVWGKLYRKGIFDNIRFAVGRAFEDTLILPRIYLACETVSFIDGEYYYYVQQPGSVMHQKYGLARRCEFIDSRIQKIITFYDNGLSDASYGFDRTLIEIFMTYFAEYLSHMPPGELAVWKPEYDKRGAWFAAQEWIIHNGRTKLNLLERYGGGL